MEVIDGDAIGSANGFVEEGGEVPDIECAVTRGRGKDRWVDGAPDNCFI